MTYYAGTQEEETSGVLSGVVRSVIREYEWTTEPPTQEGWYWMRVDDEDPQIVKVFYSPNRGKFIFTDEEDHDVGCYSHWLGPLPVPELPKG